MYASEAQISVVQDEVEDITGHGDKTTIFMNDFPDSRSVRLVLGLLNQEELWMVYMLSFLSLIPLSFLSLPFPQLIPGHIVHQGLHFKGRVESGTTVTEQAVQIGRLQNMASRGRPAGACK